MFIIPKIALILFAGLFQSPQEPLQNSQSSLSAKTKQFSVLERIEPRTAPTQPVAQVAQLPQDMNSKSSRRKIVRLPSEPQAPRPEIEKHPQFRLQFSGADLVQAGKLQTFKIRLDNVWPSDSHSVQLRLGMPPGFQFADSDVRAMYDPNRKVVAWDLTSVPANSGIEIHFRAKAIGQGPQVHQISLIQNRTVQSIQQLETFVLLGKHLSNQLPVRRLPSRVFPQPGRNNPMVARELPPIVQSNEVTSQSKPAQNQKPMHGPPLPIYRR